MNTLTSRQQLVADAIVYASSHQEELLDLIQTICLIPAPSHYEQRRAEFIKAWLEKHGCKGVYIDSACNVIYRYATHHKEAVAFLAHIDTVFPELTPLSITVEGDRMYCPGIGDDTANVVVLMLMARYFAQHELDVKHEIMFVFDSCEEGLGNLKGCRHLFDDFGHRITQMMALDGTYEGICQEAVGSLRYEVKVKTRGGHSYSDFGNSNAIALIARFIDDLYSIQVPSGTTYNVGEIRGGTSVNTIAQSASILYEIRSTQPVQMDAVKKYFEQLVRAYEAKGVEMHVMLLGERPGMGEVDALKQQELIERCSMVIEKHTGEKPRLYAGSTDCNISFSRGVVSACFGAYRGGGAHTTEEYIEISSLRIGFAIVAECMMHYVLAQ